MARCPKCNSALPPNSAVGQIAQCRVCAHIFELEDPDAAASVAAPAPPPVPAPAPAPSPAPPPARQVAEPVRRDPVEEVSLEPTQVVRRETIPLGYPPSTVKVRNHSHGIELELPWSRDQNLAGQAIGMVLWIAPFAFLGMSDVEDLSAMGVSFAFLFSMFFFYSWLTNIVNHTTVLIGNSGVEVSHGPLPNVNPTVSVRANQIGRLYVKEIMHRTKGGRYYKYQLETTGRGSKVLTKQWNKRQTMEFVQEAIEKALDLPPGG